jgi:hypothetical protein
VKATGRALKDFGATAADGMLFLYAGFGSISGSALVLLSGWKASQLWKSIVLPNHVILSHFVVRQRAKSSGLVAVASQ